MEASDKSCLSQNNNGAGHLYADSKYAHFSQITETNKSRFPLFQKASPIIFTLEAGDCLFIPAKWWHWVKSYGDRCLSINYWFSESTENSSANSTENSKQPQLHKNLVKDWPAVSKWTNDYLTETCNRVTPDGLWVWTSGFAYKQRITMPEFIQKYYRAGGDKEFAYLITLKDYEHKDSPSNGRLLDALVDDFTFPFQDRYQEYGCNFWMNFGGIDTGLHFDDQDGLLCVVAGTKQVTLYAPSDTPYLAPYPEQAILLAPTNRKFMYNLYLDLGEFNPPISITSSKILELTLRKAPNLANYVAKLQTKFGTGNIMYGIKNNNGHIKWEFYFYGVDRFSQTYQDKVLLFEIPEYNSSLCLDDYLEFHQQELCPNEPSLDISKIDRNGLILYSVDFDEESAMTGKLEKLNLYYAIADRIETPFILHEHTFFLNNQSTSNNKTTTSETVSSATTTSQINSIQYIGLFSACFASLESLFTICLSIGITVNDIHNLVKFCNYSNYRCKTVNIVNKRTEVGIYFFGISYQSFVDFLREYRYPPEVLSLCSENPDSISKLELEVGFHLPKGASNGLPSRTAFYGLF